MVMYFKNETALDYFLKNGKIYTLRKHRRKKTGKDWITLGKLAPDDDPPVREKIADVIIREIGLADLTIKKVATIDGDLFNLEDFAKESGFYDVDYWIEVYRHFAGKRSTQAWLYEVTLLKIYGLPEEADA